MTVAPVFLLGESSIEVHGGHAQAGQLRGPGDPRAPAVAQALCSSSRMSFCPPPGTPSPPPSCWNLELPWLLGPSRPPDPAWDEEAQRAALLSGHLSPQYGQKKRRYLPYNHQHLYFFLSECLLVLLEWEGDMAGAGGPYLGWHCPCHSH